MRAYGAVASIACAVAILTGCHRAADTAPPVAAIDVKPGASTVEAGGPVDLHYTFTVPAGAAALPSGDWVFVHVLDSHNELLWTDDHAPTPDTQSWRPGTPVSYTRTMFVPRATMPGDLRVEVGVFSRASGERLPLAGRDRGMRSYDAGTFAVVAPRNPVVASDGWYDPESGEGPGREWRWSRKESRLSFRNPKAPSTFYLHVDQPVAAPGSSQAVEVRGPAGTVGSFVVPSGPPQIVRVKLTPEQLGAADTVDLTLSVGATFVPAALAQLHSSDTRELGIRLLGAFVEPSGNTAAP